MVERRRKEKYKSTRQFHFSFPPRVLRQVCRLEKLKSCCFPPAGYSFFSSVPPMHNTAISEPEARHFWRRSNVKQPNDRKKKVET